MEKKCYFLSKELGVMREMTSCHLNKNLIQWLESKVFDRCMKMLIVFVKYECRQLCEPPVSDAVWTRSNFSFASLNLWIILTVLFSIQSCTSAYLIRNTESKWRNVTKPRFLKGNKTAFHQKKLKLVYYKERSWDSL